MHNIGETPECLSARSSSSSEMGDILLSTSIDTMVSNRPVSDIEGWRTFHQTIVSDLIADGGNAEFSWDQFRRTDSSLQVGAANLCGPFHLARAQSDQYQLDFAGIEPSHLETYNMYIDDLNQVFSEQSCWKIDDILSELSDNVTIYKCKFPDGKLRLYTLVDKFVENTPKRILLQFSETDEQGVYKLQTIRYGNPNQLVPVTATLVPSSRRSSDVSIEQRLQNSSQKLEKTITESVIKQFRLSRTFSLETAFKEQKVETIPQALIDNFITTRVYTLEVNDPLLRIIEQNASTIDNILQIVNNLRELLLLETLDFNLNERETNSDLQILVHRYNDAVETLRVRGQDYVSPSVWDAAQVQLALAGLQQDVEDLNTQISTTASSPSQRTVLARTDGQLVPRRSAPNAFPPSASGEMFQLGMSRSAIAVFNNLDPANQMLLQQRLRDFRMLTGENGAETNLESAANYLRNIFRLDGLHGIALLFDLIFRSPFNATLVARELFGSAGGGAALTTVTNLINATSTVTNDSNLITTVTAKADQQASVITDLRHQIMQQNEQNQIDKYRTEMRNSPGHLLQAAGQTLRAVVSSKVAWAAAWSTFIGWGHTRIVLSGTRRKSLSTDDAFQRGEIAEEDRWFANERWWNFFRGQPLVRECGERVLDNWTPFQSPETLAAYERGRAERRFLYIDLYGQHRAPAPYSRPRFLSSTSGARAELGSSSRKKFTGISVSSDFWDGVGRILPAPVRLLLGVLGPAGFVIKNFGSALNFINVNCKPKKPDDRPDDPGSSGGSGIAGGGITG
jgi:hypothetical protein